MKRESVAKFFDAAKALEHQADVVFKAAFGTGRKKEPLDLVVIRDRVNRLGHDFTMEHVAASVLNLLARGRIDRLRGGVLFVPLSKRVAKRAPATISPK